MSIKKSVLKTLEENRGEFFSGEELANSLNVSRAAVWKVIKQLEKEGYVIRAVQNRGYCLDNNNDFVSEEGIKTYLNASNQQLEIHVKKVTESTNKDAKACAIDGGGHGTIFVAQEQTAGRGRRGRDFISMNGNNIYMSLLLKPKVSSDEIVLITTAASVAVHRAILKVTGKKTQIKWVNDLYYKKHKVCGILTEAVTDCESGMIDSIILGIGINFNVRKEMIPEELKNIATALYDGDSGLVTRNELIAEVVNQILELYEQLPAKDYLEDYRENSMVIGKEVTVYTSEGPKKAKAVGIADNGGLIVAYEDKRQEVLCSGEITIRI